MAEHLLALSAPCDDFKIIRSFSLYEAGGPQLVELIPVTTQQLGILLLPPPP